MTTPYFRPFASGAYGMPSSGAPAYQFGAARIGPPRLGITGDLSQPMEGKYLQHVDVMLKVYDENWSLIGEVKVTDDIPADYDTGHSGRPHLAIVEDKIYVAYDSTETGDIKIFVKEYQFE